MDFEQTLLNKFVNYKSRQVVRPEYYAPSIDPDG